MSKIGKRPIQIPDGVNLEIDGQHIKASADGKELSLIMPDCISAAKNDNILNVSRKNEEKQSRAMHGLFARLISNIITGVKEGFTRTLEFKGTGYRASVNGNELVLWMGYSHEIKLQVPEGLETKVVKNSIIVSGIDKHKVGQFAAIIRDVRPPEVYKGKGIKYIEEHIRRKAGKTASSK